MTQKKTENWFETWFDSPFYHKLYQNRDFSEAEFFIKNLVDFLQLQKNQKVLDLACGKGRHAFYLSQFGLEVLGLDLAENSILEAQKLTTENLSFDVHDMREIYPNTKFDVVFNLFTSFGYFDDETDNLKVLSSINSMLNEDGKLVIDFMNATKIITNLVAKEEKSCEKTTFHIERNYDGKHIFKNISFKDENQEYNFTERVQALKLADFKMLLEKSGFELLHTFGDFSLASFDETNSPRLILIARKK
ncbi:MAG: class I SAM-dependent methyltransferase [Bacteroidota bacterium]